HFQRPLEVRLGAIEIAVVEEHLAEEEGELVVVAIELESLFERAHAAIGIECVEGAVGFADVLLEPLALVASEKRDDAVAALVEALLLFEREHLLAHLRFPQLDQLVGGDEVLLLQELFRGEEPGLVDEDGALMLADGVDQRTNGLGGTLDDLFERGNALQKVLVERYV